MERERLDITKIRTVEDLNNTDFSKYTSDTFKSWVKYINNPVTQNDLDRVCNLSEQEGSKVILGWTMGELYYRMRAMPQIKTPKQMVL